MLTRILLAVTLVTGPGVFIPATSADATPVLAPQPAVAAGTPDAPADVSVSDVPVVVPPTDEAGAVVEPAQVPDGAVVASEPESAARVPEAGDRLVTEEIATGEAQTLGLTWPEGAHNAADLGAQVRTRTGDEWTDWQELPVEDSAPDADTADAASGARDGTSSVWFGDAEAVQLSFAPSTEGGPEDLRAVLVGSEEADAGAATPQHAPTGGAVEGADMTGDAVVRTAAFTPTAATSPAAPAAVRTAAFAPAAAVRTGPPAIYLRSQWGAAAPTCAPDVAGSLVGAVVHHTAGSNDYTSVAQAMQMIRNDQNYHMKGRGWCDLGYNFVVDKWGNVYEGRVGSMTSPVIGVHAGGFNTGTVGVSMLGTYSAVPPAATVSAVASVIGWRLSAYNVDPTGTMQYKTGAGENSRYKNQTVTLPRVFGHRDVSYTECPGNGGYAMLQSIRDQARAYLDPAAAAAARSVVTALYADLLGRGPDPTGLAGWSSVLLSGTSQSVLVETLTRSDEYISKRVAKAYREVLGREPEAAGAQVWLVEIRSGKATVDDAQRRFYDSDEYFLTSGGTMEGYVQRLYTTMLRRGASAAEVNEWVVLSGSRGRAWVVDSIWWSREAAAVRAGDYYQTFLGRGPDPSGLVTWVDALLGRGEGAVREGIAGSQEYRARAIARFP